MKEYVIGMDIGGTKTAVGLTDLQGNLKAFRSFPTVNVDDLFVEIHKQACGILEDLGIREEEVLGAGAGVPGFTDTGSGVVAEAPALGWVNFPVRDRLREAFPSWPVAVDNDVNAATLGEQWIGRGRGKSDFIYISLGTGIGSGVVVNGKLLRGSRFSAGEIGYMVTDRHQSDRFVPSFKGYGFLESTAGGAAIGDALSNVLGRKVTAEDAFRMYRQGDQAAMELVAGALDHLGMAVANAASLLDPEIIIVGGGLANASDIILPAIARTVDRFAPNRCEIVRSSLGDWAGVIGAAALFLSETGRL